MKSYYHGRSQYKSLSVGELRARAGRSLNRAARDGADFEPVVVLGRKISESWWGQAWCQNLERYADYANRIGRGKRYVRSGAVVDLKISTGLISGRVQGSRRTPYKVEIAIKPISAGVYKNILSRCCLKVQTLEALIEGNFPEELKELFLDKEGLFPTPEEISFDCSCPDWASMCKHVAAVMYAVAVRLDENPFWFFQLRGIDVDKLIGTTLDSKVDQMIKNARKPNPRILKGADLVGLFGIEK
mgnify:CR=1 FL=1